MKRKLCAPGSTVITRSGESEFPALAGVATVIAGAAARADLTTPGHHVPGANPLVVSVKSSNGLSMTLSRRMTRAVASPA